MYIEELKGNISNIRNINIDTFTTVYDISNSYIKDVWFRVHITFYKAYNGTYIATDIIYITNYDIPIIKYYKYHDAIKITFESLLNIRLI